MVKIDAFENALRNKLLGPDCFRVWGQASLIIWIQSCMKLVVLSLSLLNAETLASIWTHCQQTYEGNLDGAGYHHESGLGLRGRLKRPAALE